MPRVLALEGEGNADSSRPRVLIVVNGSFHGYSGGDLHIAHAARTWSARSHVEVVLPVGSSPHVEQLFDVASKPRARKALGYLTMVLLYLRRMMTTSWFVLTRPERWQVVVASTHYPFDLTPVMAARGPLKRAVYWHHHLEPRSLRPLFVRALVRVSEEATARLITFFDMRVLTSSQSTREYLMARGVPQDRIAITQQGRSSGPDSVIVESLPRVDDRPFVLYCARQSRVKGADTLARIIPAVLAHDARTSVVMCGSRGDQTDMIMELARRYESTGRVFSMGFVSDEVKNWLQARAHVLIAPSEEEGWGYGVGEGLQAGAWVVAYDLDAVRAAHPHGPIYVPVGDVDRLVDAVLAALSEPRRVASKTTELRSWRNIATDDWRHIVGEVPTSQA
jgi:glycosyltransferase involved in cell wall biosynthesis